MKQFDLPAPGHQQAFEVAFGSKDLPEPVNKNKGKKGKGTETATDAGTTAVAIAGTDGDKPAATTEDGAKPVKPPAKPINLLTAMNRLNVFEVQMSQLRGKLGERKPAMKTMLDGYLTTLEDIKSRVETALYAGGAEPEDLIAESMSFCSSKTMKADITLAGKLSKD
jgi:hypothetical protein